MSACGTALALGTRFVAREHLGRARILFNRIAAADKAFCATHDAITERMGCRVGKAPRYRDLTELERKWRAQMPTEGRIRLQIDRPKRGIRITETRLATCKLKTREWENAEGGEPGISAISMWIQFAPEGFRHGCVHHAAVSLHAIGRRFSRGFDCSEGAVVGDLCALAEAEITAEPAELFTVVRPDGRWVGRATVIAGGEKVPLVRTWLDPEE